MSAPSSASFILFEDIVEVKDLNDKHFAKVSRLECTSENFDLKIKVDINSQIYKVSQGDKLNFALASSLSLDDQPDDGVYDQARNKSSLVDDYEYVAYGKVFKYEVVDQKVVACVSFGGLLMSIVGDPRHLTLTLDSRLYMLMRRVKH